MTGRIIMEKKRVIRAGIVMLSCWLFLVFSLESQTLQMLTVEKPIQNRGFEQVVKRNADEEEIKGLLSSGWKFDPENYPWMWRLNPAAPGTIEVVTGISHGGERSIKLAAGGHLYYIYGEVKPGKAYRLSVWARGEGKICLYAYKYGEGKFKGIEEMLSNQELTDEWKEYSAVYEPEDASVSALNPGITATGAGCYLDDFNFVEIKTEKGDM